MTPLYLPIVLISLCRLFGAQGQYGQGFNATFMENASASVLTQIPAPRKASARIALVGLPDSSCGVLTECFRQFGVEPVPMTREAALRLKTEKFEACAMNLVPGVEGVLEAARGSPSNSRMVIYGVGGSIQDTLRFSKYGVNAVFNEPLERQAALKLVRATQVLVLHEFRRYVRIPVITEVSVVMADGRRFAATSQEISSGGMSLTAPEAVAAGQSLEISFALLTLPRIWVRGNVSWRKVPSRRMGIHFDPHDERRGKIKEWIDAYLEC